MATPDPRLDLVLEFVSLVTDICKRHRRFGAVSLFLPPDRAPFVIICDDPCTVAAFHRELYEAADHCELHRTASLLRHGSMEYHFQPLPTLEELYGHG